MRETEEKNVLDFLSRVIAYRASLPGTHLLVFTLVIWAAFSLVLLADARNQLNQWCFTGGMMFSVGALKEYLYYGLGPSLIASGIWTQAGASLMYSILSAAFYLLAIPCVMMFAFYFAQLNQTRFFPLLRVVVWLPAVCLSVRFPPDRVASLQRDPVFCLSIAGYNVLFGLIATLILLRALWAERHGGHNRQRRLVAVSVLLPLWVCQCSKIRTHSSFRRDLCSDFLFMFQRTANRLDFHAQKSPADPPAGLPFTIQFSPDPRRLRRACAPIEALFRPSRR